MGYLDPYILPEDTVIASLSEMPRTVRREIGAQVGDYAVTRPWSRLPSTVVDALTAALLQRFREPNTIVEAVVELCIAEGLDPRAFIGEAAQMVRRLADEGVLVPAGSPLAARIVSELATGDRLGQTEVIEPVQVLVDAEVHRGRAADGTMVAIKIARRAARPSAVAAMVHEARVLERIGGDMAPELVASGDVDGRPWIATRWCAGVDAATAAAALRGLDGTAAPDALLALADSVLNAYARLHVSGVVHGDVHPRNLVVDDSGTVRMIDFGAAVLEGVGAGAQAGHRAGIDLYSEPEVAEAALAGAPLPAPTPAGEQFALGVLLSVLLVGDHPYGFTADPGELLQRILNRPASFDKRLSYWAGVDRVILRAMERRPEERYDSVMALLDEFRTAVASPPHIGAIPSTAERGGPTGASRLPAAFLDRLAPRSARFEPLPASDPFVMHGRAGRAWAMLRCAESRGDPELLAVADLWATDAARAVSGNRGTDSLMYGTFGVHAVRLAVARARADEPEQAAAWAALLSSAAGSSGATDITHGDAGLLLGCADILPDAPPSELRLLVGLGDRLADGVRAEVCLPYGVAHGSAGRLLALLRWAEATGAPPRDEVTERLDSLARATTRPTWLHGRVSGELAPGHSLIASWCNGAAGFVHLWLAASRVLSDGRWHRLAEQAGQAVEQGSGTASGDLCCGLGGQAYALLALHRASGDARWLESGRRLADGASELIARVRPDVRDSLFAGEPGVAALFADLDDPGEARMPLVGV